jgi:hypothetical protein
MSLNLKSIEHLGESTFDVIVYSLFDIDSTRQQFSSNRSSFFFRRAIFVSCLFHVFVLFIDHLVIDIRHARRKNTLDQANRHWQISSHRVDGTSVRYE